MLLDWNIRDNFHQFLLKLTLRINLREINLIQMNIYLIFSIAIFLLSEISGIWEKYGKDSGLRAIAM